MKQCTKCLKEKGFDEFSKRNASSDKLHSWCKSCKRQYDSSYYKNNPSRKNQIRASNKIRKNKIRDNILNYLNQHGCVDCGEDDPIVLDFDHHSDKIDNVSTMIRDCKSWEVILNEIQKCDVRCANCHRRKTAKDFGWWQTKHAADAEMVLRLSCKQE